MPGRDTSSPESVLARLVRLEVGHMNGGVAAGRRSLSDLLADPDPLVKTRGGGVIRFDRGLLGDLARCLHPGEAHRLRLPIIFFRDSTYPASCELHDEVALGLLQALGVVNSLYKMDEGRVHLSTPLVRELERQYPSLIQIMTI